MQADGGSRFQGKVCHMIGVVLAALGVLAIVYGVSVMMLHSGTSFFLVWYGIGGLLLAAAGITFAGGWSLLPHAVRVVSAAVLVVGALAFAYTQALIVSQFGADYEDGLDCIIVLGAQVRADGSPSGVLGYRLEAAYEYLERNPETRCIVSGGKGPNEPMAEADGMAAYLEKRGIAPERIVRERESLNTKQNIVNSMVLLDAEADRVGIVTNDFHVFRATSIARKAGMRHVFGIAAYSVPWYQPNNMLREGMGILKDYAAGNL